MNLNLLFIGDIVGKGGRNAVKNCAANLRQKHTCSFCIANAENIAGGAGMTAKCLQDICPSPADVITSGDHVWDQKGFDLEIMSLDRVLRPANVSSLQPGKGYGVYRNPACGEVAVINLIGRVFMKNAVNCPFDTADRILKEIPRTVKSIFVDFHAEASSEKAAMAHFLDGRVTAVVGTHTHVQTADAKILPGGTAFITDIGMVGSENSILGRDVKSVLRKFSTGMPCKLNVVDENIRIDAAVISYDPVTGHASEIKSFSIMADL